MSDEERAKIKLNVNRDAVARATYLTAITSEYSKLPHLLAALAQDLPLSCHDALMRNSDHYSAVGGIPAFRLVAGFDQPELHLRYVLTREHASEKTAESVMQRAVRLTASVAVFHIDDGDARPYGVIWRLTRPLSAGGQACLRISRVPPRP